MHDRVSSRSQIRQPLTVQDGLRIPVPGVTRVLVDLAGESSPREALVGTDGFLTLGHPGKNDEADHGEPDPRRTTPAARRCTTRRTKPVTPPSQPTVDPSVTVKTAEPITPQVVLTKDPQTREALAPAPPVSPLTDEQITDPMPPHGARQRHTSTAAGSRTQDPREQGRRAGHEDWEVALKTGTGDKFTAVLVSPDKRVDAWCHMLTPTAKGGQYDYRPARRARGRQVRGRPRVRRWCPRASRRSSSTCRSGPTRALIANGYYIWGLTGGNSDIKTSGSADTTPRASRCTTRRSRSTPTRLSGQAKISR